MNRFGSITDPTDLDALRAVISASDGADSLVPLGMRRLEISPAASSYAADQVRRLLEDRGAGTKDARVLLLGDATLIRRGGEDLKGSVAAQLEKAGFDVVRLVLGTPGHSLHADESALQEAASAASGMDVVVVVGSGTVTDIGKVATDRAGGIPLVVVQTAASVDGFTDNVSVVLSSGVKRTIPSRWPDAVLADTVTIATAPTELNTAGFGELLSLFTAPADWRLAALAGLDATFHPTPRDLLLAFAGDPSEWSAGLSDGEPAPVEQLTRVLAIRGIGTGIAGTTACLSGVEHLVSHMLDMHAAARGLPTGLHGAQVGAASVVAAATWEHFAARAAVEAPVLAPLDLVAAEAEVLRTFAHLDPTGRLGAECWSDCERKLRAIDAQRERIAALLADVPGLFGDAASSLATPDALAGSLRDAGAAAGPDELSPWIDDDLWRWAVAGCHRMRNRFTIVDLLDLLGWWSDDDVDWVLSRARTAGEGVRA
ncbi:iron-containing alcohol dehydrogenase [Agromyces sp. C10]|uniref:iron-containing alcohol dehydrogenase n=1 Tax=Agromyces sp. C10 TaxID=2935077 RepID=UPI00200A77E9|nr:iron-containing alcohol dehydrogenase [Agromyces sp. C10]MCK8610109.1 iron-containing alcohol dehydrogenase [Agromyces sp. C10]